MSENIRRLPIYLLLDCSGSMMGEAIVAVQQGVRSLLADLRRSPQAMETAALSVITFSNSATQVCPLTDLPAFQEPTLSASGSTAMGAALRLLEDAIGREVRQASPDCRGDYRPLVFILSDGCPSDEWEPAADRIKRLKFANIIACAAGPGADTTCLKRITEIVVTLSNLEPSQFAAFFKWVSASVKVASTAIQGQPTALPPPPNGINLVL